MPRRETGELVRVHIWIFREDLEWIRQHHGDKLGVAKFVRTLIRSFRKKVDARVAEEVDQDSEPLTLESLNV